jgi:ribosomal protein S18 acetylase RimI-like enzyme
VSTAVLAIAPATPDDVEAIMACERRPGYEDTVGRWSREEHLAGMADASHRYFVGRDASGLVAGFVILQQIGVPADIVLIRRVAMAEQGRGHGSALLGHALAHIFDELQANRAWLRVWPHNPRGIALYSKLGMREDGVSEVERDGAPALMTVMAIDAEGYRARHQRSMSP